MKKISGFIADFKLTVLEDYLALEGEIGTAVWIQTKFSENGIALLLVNAIGSTVII